MEKMVKKERSATNENHSLKILVPAKTISNSTSPIYKKPHIKSFKSLEKS